MNQIGEIIQIETITKNCRNLDPNELMQLLKSDINVFWSWGVEKLIIDSKSNTKMLRLTVNGHHHKGHVFIFLNGLDLFDVYLTSRTGKIKTIIEGLYFDQLVDWIDEKIEKIPAYN